MKILVSEKYQISNNKQIERYIIFFGKDEGTYYKDDWHTGKHGIRAILNNIENGKSTYYGEYVAPQAVTKHSVIIEVLGGNGYAEGYIPDITIIDLETGHKFNVAEYMKTNNLTKFNGGLDNAEKYFEYMYKN